MISQLFFLLSALAIQNDTVQQVSDPVSDPDVSQVFVTASKKHQRVENLATAISVVTKAEILEKNITLLPDLLREEAGVYIQQTTPGQGIPIIRGLKGSENVHLIDGMRLNTAFFRNSPNQYLALVDPFMTEQIEIIRGPASVLYGGDALGGVLNVITHTPSFQGEDWQYLGEMFVSYDSADQKTLSHLSLDFGNEKIATTLGLSYQDIGTRTIGGGNKVPFTEYISKAFNNKWVFNLGENKQLKFDVQYLTQPATPRVDDLVTGFGQTQPDSSLFLFAPNQRQFVHLSYNDTSATSFYDEANFQVASQLIKDHRIRSAFDSEVITKEQNESALFSFQTSFNKQFSDTFDAVYGLDFYNDIISSAKQRIVNEITSIEDPRFPDDSSMRHVGLFADFTTEVGNHNLTLGFRYSDYKIDLNSSNIDNDTLNLNDLTWNASWLYRLDDNNRLFANLGRGFRPPNIFDLGQVGERPGNRFNVINAEVKPESVHTIDMGWKHFGDTWDVDFTLFYSQYKDKISSVETGEITAAGQIIVQSQNLNDVVLYGLESSFKYLFENQGQLKAVVNYTWGEEALNNISEPADRIPPLNGFIGYSQPINNKWSINPKIIFADTQDRLSSRDTRDPRIHPDGTGGFVTYNLYLNWKISGTSKVRFGLENIFDKKYREHGSGLEAAGRNFHASFNHLF
ncbi:MAG: TonB-dependent receptor [Proteobacteria bacterium]|nr:TonB-dependent receptor [Pseudomonadota bacterium]